MNIIGKAKVVYCHEEAAAHTGIALGELSKILIDKALVVVTISKIDFWDTNFERKNMFIKKFWSLYSSAFDWFGNVSRSYYLGKKSNLSPLSY